MSHLIHEPVQLAHGYRLRIQYLVADVLVALVLDATGLQLQHSLRQHLEASRLTSTGLPNQHHSEPYVEYVEQLNYLGDELGCWLELVLRQHLGDVVLEQLVSGFFDLDAGK